MKELIGKKILGMSVSDDQHYLKFTTDQGDLIYQAWGDCCSESWFADIIVNVRYHSSEQFGDDVVEVEEIQMPLWANKVVNNDGRCRQDYDDVYGYKILTKDGSNFEVIYRNSSNGYYGGDCVHVKEPYETVEWIEITDDWSAS